MSKQNQTMKCEIICKSSHIPLILKSMIFIFLVAIFYIFFLTDVLNIFADRDSFLINSQETMEENEMNHPPYITFCMTPRAKKSILEEYKLSHGVLNEPKSNEKQIFISLNKTMEALFREVTFKLNRDFRLSINLWSYHDEFGWQNDTGTMKEGSDNFIQVRLNLERVQIKHLLAIHLHM